jgi:ABC-type lipoprotein release transport system permease subunit
MGEGLLNLRNLRVGDFLSVSDAQGEKMQLEIVGSFGAESELLTQDLLLVAPKTAQKILGLKPHECTDLAVEVWNPDEVSNLGRKIDDALPAARVVQRSQLQATYDALFSWRGGIFLYGGMLSLFAFLLLAWQHAVGLSGPERRELGILKGLGWEVRDVLLHKLNEAASVAVSATLLGLLLAWGHVFLLQAPLLKPFLVGWSVLFPSYQFLPIVQAGDLLAIALLAIVPYLTAAIIPAWRGSITDPSEVMRG